MFNSFDRIERPSAAPPSSCARAYLRVFPLTLLVLLACSDTQTEAPASTAPDFAASVDPRPSIVLFVIESLRTDALMSYPGDSASPLQKMLAKAPVEGHDTKRVAAAHFDALARSGLRYDWAIAAAPDTITSHASILTGLRPDQHGVGVWQESVAPDSLGFIAERLAASGYETAAFVENPMLNEDSGLLQGFARVETPRLESAIANTRKGVSPTRGFDLVGRVAKWSERRDPNRPYFLFVNLLDPHLPLDPDPNGAFVPTDTSRQRLIDLAGKEGLRNQICSRLPDPQRLELIRALYLSEVVRADQKLGRLVDLLTQDSSPELITIATADHGTHLGEGDLLGHQFALDNRVLRVPLVVNGPAIQRGVIQGPVAQRRIANSILCWAGEDELCTDRLPEVDPVESDPIYSIASETRSPRPASAFIDTGSLDGSAHHGRVYCSRESTLFGRAVSMIRWPMKFEWREVGAPRIFDLSWDPQERSNQFERMAAGQSGQRDALHTASTQFVRDNRLDQLRLNAPTGSLAERARFAFDEARGALLADLDVEVDAIWFTQLTTKDLPDPELERWIEERILEQAANPFLPIVAPETTERMTLPEKPARGVASWGEALLASVAHDDPRATDLLERYLAMDAEGYILTHQLTALVWSQTVGRTLSIDAEQAKRNYLDRIAAELAGDAIFTDLWIERAALVARFGSPTPEALEAYVEFTLANHLGGGDWGEYAAEISFDAQSKVATQPREHPRGLAMVLLARYLRNVEGG